MEIAKLTAATLGNSRNRKRLMTVQAERQFGHTRDELVGQKVKKMASRRILAQSQLFQGQERVFWWLVEGLNNKAKVTMDFAHSASWNSRSITHLANRPSRSLPANSSDESLFSNGVRASSTGLTWQILSLVSIKHPAG
jgi:hypothetical protein